MPAEKSVHRAVHAQDGGEPALDAREVGRERHLEIRVLLIARPHPVRRGVDVARERDEPDARAPRIEAAHERARRRDLRVEDRVLGIGAEDVGRELALGVEAFLRVLAHEAVAVDVGTARILRRAGDVEHDHDVEALRLLAGRDRGAAHLDDVSFALIVAPCPGASTMTRMPAGACCTAATAGEPSVASSSPPCASALLAASTRVALRRGSQGCRARTKTSEREIVPRVRYGFAGSGVEAPGAGLFFAHDAPER